MFGSLLSRRDNPKKQSTEFDVFLEEHVKLAEAKYKDAKAAMAQINQQIAAIDSENKRLSEIEDLRDRFAMAALSGIMASDEMFFQATSLARAAGLSYIMADHMLEARKKQDNCT